MIQSHLDNHILVLFLIVNVNKDDSMKMGARKRKLEARRKAWVNLKMCRLDPRVRSRLDSGGFREPGSLK